MRITRLPQNIHGFSTTKTFRVRKGMSIQLSCRLEMIFDNNLPRLWSPLLQSFVKSNSSSLLSVVTPVNETLTLLQVVQNVVQTTLETCYVETKGLFTWREEDPSTRKIREGGQNFSFALHAEISAEVEKEKKNNCPP